MERRKGADREWKVCLKKAQTRKHKHNKRQTKTEKRPLTSRDGVSCKNLEIYLFFFINENILKQMEMGES
jgi:hypothetical protein